MSNEISLETPIAVKRMEQNSPVIQHFVPEEHRIMEHLVSAWNLFIELESMNWEKVRFGESIHASQDVLFAHAAIRIIGDRGERK